AGSFVGSHDDSVVFGLLQNGDSCTDAIQCSSGFCVDGVCCDSACTGPCRACAKALNGAPKDGVCTPMAAGTDPEDECEDVGPCGDNGWCDGKGACQKYPAHTQCGPPSCSGSTLFTKECGAVDPGSSEGNGTCTQVQSDCDPYMCATAAQCGL